MISHRGIRYLLAGGCNLLFGICNALAMTRLFVALVPSQPKLMGTAAMLFSSFISIAFSFLIYKWFVFKTKGNYFREYLRSLLVYLPSTAINTLAVAPLSIALNPANAPIERLTGIHGGSIYLATVSLVGMTFILSFFGHKHISFRSPNDSKESALQSGGQRRDCSFQGGVYSVSYRKHNDKKS
jgi:putative flippase GtrA